MLLVAGHCDCLCSEYVYSVHAGAACPEHTLVFG